MYSKCGDRGGCKQNSTPSFLNGTAFNELKRLLGFSSLKLQMRINIWKHLKTNSDNPNLYLNSRDFISFPLSKWKVLFYYSIHNLKAILEVVNGYTIRIYILIYCVFGRF